jgi:hypothetical protein
MELESFQARLHPGFTSDIWSSGKLSPSAESRPLFCADETGGRGGELTCVP